jgi:hypothetical protein
MISEYDFDQLFSPLYRDDEPILIDANNTHLLTGRMTRLNLLPNSIIEQVDINKQRIGLEQEAFDVIKKHLWTALTDEVNNTYLHPGIVSQSKVYVVTQKPWVLPDEPAEYLIQARKVEWDDTNEVVFEKFLNAYDYDNYQFINSEFIQQNRIIPAITRIAVHDHNENLLELLHLKQQDDDDFSNSPR